MPQKARVDTGIPERQGFPVHPDRPVLQQSQDLKQMPGDVVPKPGHVLFGSDFPFAPPVAVQYFTGRANQAERLDQVGGHEFGCARVG